MVLGILVAKRSRNQAEKAFLGYLERSCRKADGCPKTKTFESM